VTPLPLPSLFRFCRLMQREGNPVDFERMCLDTRYAFERLAQAHASACEPLRRMALDLFSTYDRNRCHTSVH
jgi:hypothetical protein